MATLEQVINDVKSLAPEERRRLLVALESLDANGTKPGDPIDSAQEHKWIDAHRDEYLGQWVAVEDDQLVAHGSDPRKVYLSARNAGIEIPFVVRVQKSDEPSSGGWL
ncbi:MAG: DUF5678 domain-containing protein [Pyrinomonadaceae bacterium]